MAQRINAGCNLAARRACRFCASRGVFAQVVDDRARCGQRLRMAVQSEAGHLGNAELFAQDALGVVVMKNPVFKPRFYPAVAVEHRGLRGFEKLLWSGKQRFSWPQEL